MTNEMIEVVGAAILKDNKVLAMQRSQEMTLPGMWEFPGGKIETHETEEEALIREIQEELDVTIKILEYVNEASYAYDFGTVSLQVFTAEIVSGELSLEEHSDGKWLSADELTEVNWAPVDIPAVKALVKILKQKPR